MAVNQNDLDLLNSYLDGELPVAESEGLWRRLAVERDLSAELDQLRADSAIRSSMWSSFEPDDRTVARVESNVMRAARREDVYSTIARITRVGSVAAACILFGFSIGWLGRPGAAGPANPSPSAQIAPVALGAHKPVPGMGPNVVNVYDQSGNLVATKQFQTIDEARQFAHDIGAAQSAPQPARDSNIVPAMNRF